MQRFVLNFHKLNVAVACVGDHAITRMWWGPVMQGMLRHNTIAAWETMQKSGGWKQCRRDGEEGQSAHPIHFLPSLNAKVKAKLTATNEISSFY